MKTDAVVIGRNEGARLIACLASLKGQVRRVVYVDSGSKDASVAAAQAAGAAVVMLDPTRPFTAARARNAGFSCCLDLPDPPDFVQFVDGDCVVDPGWIATALRHLASSPACAVACGRRRERFPQASVYHRLIDAEWDTPVGRTRACGGDAMIRAAALAAIGGYREGLIAGEEPEMCLRLRAAGWDVWRLDAEMTLHDAAMTRFGQWWRRTRRAGHAYAEGATLHPGHWVVEQRRAVLWGAVLPGLIAAAALVHPGALALALAYPAQILRLSRRLGWEGAAFNVLGKFAEAQGAIGFHIGRVTRRRARIIEYKSGA